MRGLLRRGVAQLGWLTDQHLPPVRAFLSGGLTVFLYHEITDTPSEFQRLSLGFTRPEHLDRQLAWIGDRFTFIKPTELPALGGTGILPKNAALVSFDDAWAGCFSTGLTVLQARGVPSLWFVNMGTVLGAPDLAAVRRYERLRDGHSRLDDSVDEQQLDPVIAEITHRYGEDPEFLRFQGPTVSAVELEATAQREVWLGSHLFHHWHADRVTPSVLQRSAAMNREALSGYPNAVAALATPHGVRIDWSRERAESIAAKTLFVASGGQNRDPTVEVLDRLELEHEPSDPPDWWWAAHRRRIFRSLAS